MRLGRRLNIMALSAALVAGLVGGGALGLLAQGTPRLGEGSTPAGTERPRGAADPGARWPSASTSPPSPVIPDTLLAWTPGHLPAGFATAVRRMPGVRHAVAVQSGTAWLTGSFGSEGGAVDRPPSGLAIPIEVAGADLREYAAFLSPGDRTALSQLSSGGGALGASSAALRGIEPGGVLAFGAHRVQVAAVFADSEMGAHELFVSRDTAAALGVRLDRYLLIDPAPGLSRRRLTARLRALVPTGTPLRIRGPGETPYFRQGDAVLPPIRLKEVFGEFAASPLPDGFLRMDPRWVGSHIASARVPLLGTVQCSRALLPQLRGALEEVVSEGLASSIRSADYGGCYSPRFVSENRLAGISHHAWGAAIDINVRTNPFGRTPHQDPRLVAVFQRWGFTWGGGWLVPDGMHFEFARIRSGGPG